MVSTHQKPRFSAAFFICSFYFILVVNLRGYPPVDTTTMPNQKKCLLYQYISDVPIDGKRWNSLLKERVPPEFHMEPQIRGGKMSFPLVTASLGFHVKWCHGSQKKTKTELKTPPVPSPDLQIRHHGTGQRDTKSQGQAQLVLLGHYPTDFRGEEV